jgi:hypothetical protein
MTGNTYSQIIFLLIINILSIFTITGEIMNKALLISIIFLIITGSVSAKETCQVNRALTPSVINGIMSEGEWDNALYLDTFYQTKPGNNTAPSEKTELYLMNDDQNVYLFAKCDMADISKIRANHCARDRIESNDRVIAYFNSFNFNHESSVYYIGANAYGEQTDGLFGSSGVDFLFESKGIMTDDGWQVEMKLPLQSIKYRSGEKAIWGFFFRRYIEADSEEVTASKVDRNAILYNDNYVLLEFDYLAPTQHFTVMPAVIGNMTGKSWWYDETGYEDGGSEFDSDGQAEVNIFYEPSYNLTAAITINPDYSIIEADGIAVNVNSTDPIYYNEKRPFFSERITRYQSAISVYHTRNFVNPKLGAKISGSFDGFAFSGIYALDEDVPAARFSLEGKSRDTHLAFFNGVFRDRMSDSFYRLGSSYREFDGKKNVVVNYDGVFRISDHIKMDYDYVWSFYDKANYDADGVETDVEYTPGYGYYHSIFWDSEEVFARIYTKGLFEDFRADLSPEFRPDLGWYADVNTREYYGIATYKFQPDSDREFYHYMEAGISSNLEYSYHYDDSKPLSVVGQFWAGANLKNNLSIWAGYYREREKWNGEYFELSQPWVEISWSPLEVIEGGFESNFFSRHLLYSYQNAKVHDYFKLEPWLRIVPSSHIDMEIRGRYREMDSCYILRTLETTTKIQVTDNFWMRHILQLQDYDLGYQNIRDMFVNSYLLVAYIPSANNAVYFGANIAYFQDEFQNLPDEPYYDEHNNMFFIKISQAFDIVF